MKPSKGQLVVGFGFAFTGLYLIFVLLVLA